MEEAQDGSDGNGQTSYDARTANAKIARRRAVLACDTCRSRRTKCDGRKPACSFCEEHGIPCNYRSVPPAVPSK